MAWGTWLHLPLGRTQDKPALKVEEQKPASFQRSAHLAPADNSDAIFELKAGDLVTIRREQANFALVRTLDQHSGWVSETDIARIIPPEATLSPM